MEPEVIKDQLAKLHESAFGWAMLCCRRDREMACEVLQQAYCRILGGDAVFSGRSEFATWVFGVIRHVAMEELRRERKQKQRVKSSLEFESTSIAESSDLEMEQRELAEQLCAAMQEISERQREVLHLTFYEQMTIRQAAQVMEISVGAASQHYQRGKASLHRILSNNREFECD